MVTDRQGQGCCKETSEVGSRLFSQDGHFCHDIGFAYFRSGSFELNILTTQETDFFVVEFEFDGFFFSFFLFGLFGSWDSECTGLVCVLSFICRFVQ